MNQPKEPKLVSEEWAGGKHGGQYYEQIVDEKGVSHFITKIPKTPITEGKPLKDWTQAFSIEDYLEDSDSETYKITHKIPVKRILWPTVGPIPTERLTHYDLWEEIRSYIYDHIELPDEELYHVLTAWVISSWIPERWQSVPYLFINGPKNSGKTRVLDVLTQLVYRGFSSCSTSGPALFRAIEAYRLTFLLDESEIYNNEQRQDCIGLLNSGYRRGQYALRVSGEDMTLKSFDVFGFKALAGTQSLIPTLESRSIVIVMSRLSRKEIRYTIDEKRAQDIRNQLLLWRLDKLEEFDKPDKVGNPDVLTGTPPSSQDLLIGAAQKQLGLDSSSRRFLEKYYPLLAVANNGIEHIISYAKRAYEVEEEEETVSEDAEVADTLRKCEHMVHKGVLKTGDISNIYNSIHQDDPRSSRSISWVLKRLGFSYRRDPERGDRGIRWNIFVLNRALRRYGLPMLEVPSRTLDKEVEPEEKEGGAPINSSGVSNSSGSSNPIPILDISPVTVSSVSTVSTPQNSSDPLDSPPSPSLLDRLENILKITGEGRWRAYTELAGQLGLKVEQYESLFEIAKSSRNILVEGARFSWAPLLEV